MIYNNYIITSGYNSFSKIHVNKLYHDCVSYIARKITYTVDKPDLDVFFLVFRNPSKKNKINQYQ